MAAQHFIVAIQLESPQPKPNPKSLERRSPLTYLLPSFSFFFFFFYTFPLSFFYPRPSSLIPKLLPILPSSLVIFDASAPILITQHSFIHCTSVTQLLLDNLFDSSLGPSPLGGEERPKKQRYPTFCQTRPPPTGLSRLTSCITRLPTAPTLTPVIATQPATNTRTAPTPLPLITAKEHHLTNSKTLQLSRKGGKRNN
jgi:hypothetical protein